jgi:hypothetical protein
MARTDENQNITRQAEFDTSAQQDQAFKRGQGQVSQFENNENTLNRGGQVAANPWESASEQRQPLGIWDAELRRECRRYQTPTSQS